MIDERLSDEKFDEVIQMNDPTIYENLPKIANSVSNLLVQHKNDFAKIRDEFSFAAFADRTKHLDQLTENLNKRLQEHIRMLDRNGSVKPSTLLECDRAKSRADTLVEVLKAKIVWSNAFDELNLLDNYATTLADQNLRFQKLVALQQSYDLLKKYALNEQSIMDFEKHKDEFLSWYNSATVVAIDSNDIKQLDTFAERFSSLNRITVFESCFYSYAENKIKSFIDEQSCDLWKLLTEVHSIWKRINKLVTSYCESEDASKKITESLYNGVSSKWEKIRELVLNMQTNLESPLIAVRELAKIRNDFSSLMSYESDEHILKTLHTICQQFFTLVADDYSKHITSSLLTTVNKITIPDKASIFQHEWIFPYLDDIQSAMLDMIMDAFTIFGSDFHNYIIGPLETGIKELNSLLLNKDILTIKGPNIDKSTKKNIQENTEDKISAICVAGYLLNMVDSINSSLSKAYEEASHCEDPDQMLFIGNRNLIESLNRKVVERKVDSIANTIIRTMEDEIDKLKRTANSETNSSTLKLSLPSFSISPHSYITTVGHWLLNQMNTMGSYNSDRNFVRSIASVAGTSRADELLYNEEADLWLLTEVSKCVQNAFCSKIGNVSTITPNLLHQFNADIVFLMEALVDLRLQPTTQLVVLADKLKHAVEQLRNNE